MLTKIIKSPRSGNSPVPSDLLSSRAPDTSSPRGFLPFIKERDSLGRLLTENGYKSGEKLKSQLKQLFFAGSPRNPTNRNLLSQLYDESNSYNKLDLSKQEMSKCDLSNSINAWRSQDYVKENKEKSYSHLKSERRIVPKLKKLRSIERLPVPPLGCYETEKATILTQPRSRITQINLERSSEIIKSPCSIIKSPRERNLYRYSPTKNRENKSPTQTWELDFKRFLAEEDRKNENFRDEETIHLVRQNTYFKNLKDFEPHVLNQNHSAINGKYSDMRSRMMKLRSDIQEQLRKPDGY